MNGMNGMNGMNRMNGINGMNGMNRMNDNVPKVEDKSPSPDYGEEQKLIPSTTPTTPMIVQVTKSPYSSFKYRSRYRAGPTRKLRRRAVLKNGDCNVLQSRISRRSLRFLQDIFTTLVDTQWRWTLMCFILSFLLSWLGFAVIWWLIAFTHGDFEENHLPPFQVESNWTPCVYNIFSFTSCFLFSIETQHTIGYGSRSTTEECPEAIFVMCIQSISGVMIQSFMAGIVFAKMTRPKQRTQTLLFSRNAVICQRDGELCLMFRVGDMRKSHIIGASIRAQMIRTRTTKEGEILSQHQRELTVGTDGENGDLFFIWPATIIHRINDSSPFYGMSAEDMLTERFEIVLILEGTVESTGQTTQARSSYLPQEILWGHRFDSMVSYSKERQGYEVDYSLFNSTTQVDTPLCSGKELAEFYKVQDDLRQGTGALIDEDHLTGRQCWCDHCHPTNQPPELSLVSLDSPRSRDSENEYHWRHAQTCKCSNCAWHGPEEIDQSKVFEFDPNAIQVIGDVELEQLPEAVNREIVRNSQEIVFKEEEQISERNLIKSHNKKNKINHSQKIIFEEGLEDGLMQRAVIDTENEETILKNSRENVFKERKKGILENIIRLNEKADSEILQNSQEAVPEERKEDFSKRTFLIKLNMKNTSKNALKNQETIFAEKKEISERKLVRLDEGKNDIMKNARHIYGEEELALVKVQEESKDIGHQIKRTSHKLGKEHKMMSNEYAKKEICLEKRQRMPDRRCQLTAEQKSPKEFSENLSDNPFAINKKARISFRESGRSAINQLILPVNRDRKNPKRNIFLNEAQEPSKEFNRSLINNPLAEDDRRFFKEFGGNAHRQIVPANPGQKNPTRSKKPEKEFFSSEKQNSSKALNRSFSDDPLMMDGRRSFRESRKNATYSTSNVGISQGDQKSVKEIKKYFATPWDRSNGSPIFHQRLNYDFLRRDQDDFYVEQYDNIGIENEKTLKRPLLDRPTKIVIQRKIHIDNIRSQRSAVADLSPESGFCEGSPEIGLKRSHLFTRRTLKDIDDILGKKNGSSLKSNSPRKNAIDDINNVEECAENYIAPISAHISGSIRDVDENRASLRDNLPYKNFIDNNNSVKHADAPNIEEQIMRLDHEMQDVHEMNKKYRCPDASRKLISNVDNSMETSSMFKKQFVYGKNNMQNVNQVPAKQKSSPLNIDAAYKSAENVDCSEKFNDIILEEQVVHSSNDDRICENLVNNAIALDYPKQYDSAFTKEQSIYESDKVENKRQIRGSLNSNISCENLINDIVDLDRSRKCSVASVAVDIV